MTKSQSTTSPNGACSPGAEVEEFLILQTLLSSEGDVRELFFEIEKTPILRVITFRNGGNLPFYESLFDMGEIPILRIITL